MGTGARVGANSLSKRVPAERRRGGPGTPNKGAASKPSTQHPGRPGQPRQRQGLQTESPRASSAQWHVCGVRNVCKVGPEIPGESTHGGSLRSQRFLGVSCSPAPQVCA